MTTHCPKCGTHWPCPKYDRRTDKVRWKCDCGYSWFTDALDKEPKKTYGGSPASVLMTGEIE